MLGELRCLNCGRHLADVLGGGAGPLRLTPPNGRAARLGLVASTARGLRCARCGGRPMLEPVPGNEAYPRPTPVVPGAQAVP